MAHRWRPLAWLAILMAAAYLLLQLFLPHRHPSESAAAPTAPQRPLPPDAASRLVEVCAAIGRRLHSVSPAVCRDAGLRLSAAVSVNGRPLMMTELAPPPLPPTAALGPLFRPLRVLMIGGIHGDELASVALVFHWITRSNSEPPEFLWRVIPMANPDGLLDTRPHRTNARGVDLNRNFSSQDWNADAMTYWRRFANSDARRNPGRGPASEPETAWLEAQVEEFRPDVIVSVHAPYGVLDFDGPRVPPMHFGFLRLHRLGVYPGSLGNYAGMDRGIPVLTLELPESGSMPTDRQLEKVWTDMIAWIKQSGRSPRQQGSQGMG